MSDGAARPRRVDFPTEGFLLLCDEAGLEITVTDYHARPLRISWQAIEAWRSEANPPEQAAAPPPRPRGRGRRRRRDAV